MNYETVLLDLAAAISRADEDTSKIGEATNINKSRELFLRVPFELLKQKEGSAIGLWLIDEADSDHMHQATLWQIVPYSSGNDAVAEATTNPNQKPAVAQIDSSVLKRNFALENQPSIQHAFPLSLQHFKGSSVRAMFANALGGKIDFFGYQDVLLPLRATTGEDYIGVLQLVTPGEKLEAELTAYSAQMTAITNIIAALIEAGRRRRRIDAIEKCQNRLLRNRSSENLAAGLAKELLVPCSALTCAIYRPGRGDTLELIAQSYDEQFSNPKTIEQDSFTYWIYQRAVRNPDNNEVAHFANLAVAYLAPEAPALKSAIDLPEGLAADRTSWLSYTVMRAAVDGFEDHVPILFIRLLTAPHRGFLGGSFSTTARGIVKSLGVHMSDTFSSLFQLEATRDMRQAARDIRETTSEFITTTDFLKLECEFAKLIRDTLRCVKSVYIAHRSTAADAITTLRDCDARPVKGMGDFAWSSKAPQLPRDGQILKLKPYHGKEGADLTIGPVGNFEYGLRLIFAGRVFAGWEGRVLTQIVDEMRIAEMSAVDINEKMRQTAEIRHALRAEMNGVLGHLFVARERYEIALDTHRRGDTATAMRHLLDSAAFRKSMKRALLSSETLGSVLENSGIYMSEMRPDKLQRGAINIVQILKEMRIAYMPELERRRLKIIERGSDNVVASCDARLVKMALFNIFDNAVKYAFNKNPITIRATDHGRHVAIAMTNIGPHIEPTHIESIFEPFKRITFKGAQPMPGTGLGLPVARKIAEVHGGQVTVLSEPFRVGGAVQAETTFTFMIPKGFK